MQIASKQPRFTQAARESVFTSFYKWVKTTLTQEPEYVVDSRARDRWLSEVWRKEPHMAGVVSSMVSINANRGWWIAGGRNQVNRYNGILRRVEGGDGWRSYMSQASTSYYTQDLGLITEIGRDGGPDGPLRDLFFVDSARCYLTGNQDIPLSYTPEAGKEQKWGATDFFRVVSMPSTDESYRKLGFCGLSRAISFVKIMTAVYDHDQEMLGAKAPRGLMLLQNISESQWIQAMTARAANLTSMEREFYAGVSVIAQEGVEQIDAKLIALSQLPANFDIEKYTSLCIYGVALCYEVDPREFWPVSQGTLGTGNETQIQHVKATGKGGIGFVLAYQDQLQQELPDTIEFQFEQRDIQGEMVEAGVKKAWADVGAVLFDKGAGVLDRDEVRIFLADAGVIPSEWTQAPDEATAEASGEISTQKRSREMDAIIGLESMWAASFENPLDALIKRDHNGKTTWLYQTGMHFLRENRAHPMARAMAVEHGWRNPTVARDIFGRSFQVVDLPMIEAKSRAASILYEDDEVTITQDDVDQAVQEGEDRMGVEFREMLEAS